MSAEELTYFRTRRGTVFEDHCRVSFDPEDVTPVVVIDPEDQRVKDIVYAARAADFASGGRERVRNLLRSWTKPVAPPKPDEPRAMYALVRDRDGLTWCRLFHYTESNLPLKTWRNEKGFWGSWDDLDIPEDGVKFEGVDPADA